MKLMLFVFILFFSCNTKEVIENKDFNYNSFATIDDDKIIRFTIREYMHTYQVGSFQSFYLNYDSIEINKFDIKVDRLYYSNDSLKFLALIIIQFTSDINPKDKFSPKGEYLSGDIIVGFRNSVTENWTIYPFKRKAWVGYEDAISLRQAFNNYMFVQFRKVTFRCLNEQNIWETKEFKYNLDEEEFWRGPLFDKELFGGVYYFQINDFNQLKEHRRGANFLIRLPEIQYPDTLLNNKG